MTIRFKVQGRLAGQGMQEHELDVDVASGVLQPARATAAGSSAAVNDPASLSGDQTFSGVNTFEDAVNTAQGSDIASAETLDLDSATGNVVDVTGTTGIAAVTLSQGRFRIVRFTGALTITHGASLVLPGGLDITTVAGAYAIFVGYASDVVRCVGYFPPVVPDESGTFTATLTGCTTSPTQTVHYARRGNLVTLTMAAGVSATSNTTAATLTGLPSRLTPARSQFLPARVQDNSSNVAGGVLVDSSGVLNFYAGYASQTAFTASGTKGVNVFTFSYALN